MKRFFPYLLFFFSGGAAAQDLPFAFRNDYDDPLLNTEEVATSYSKMYYENGEQVLELLDESQSYFNTEFAVIDEKKDFIIETQISASFGKFKTGKAGIVWGYKNNKNCNVFLLNESNQYRVFYNHEGQHPVQAFNSTGLSPAELHSKITVRIHQKNGMLHFYLNNKEVFSCPALKMYGHRIGYLVGTDIHCSYLYVKQDRGPLLVSSPALKDFVKKDHSPALPENKYNELRPLVSADAKQLFFCKRTARRHHANRKPGFGAVHS